MAIAPTGNIFKCLEFDGESSRDYGVYITGEAVYNAPERDIEMISIPGRSGAFALDKGRFENIEVRYPAGLFADNERDFAEAISDFRNFLCSKKGYCRLTDDYNPDEYRLAIYKSGLEVTPAMLRGGEFEIVFDCKPQRYLMSGESPIEVSNNEVIFNPTLFEAHPLLEVEGYGTINVNGTEIEIVDDLVGDVEIANDIHNQSTPISYDYSNVYVVSGDEIDINNLVFTRWFYKATGTNYYITDAEITQVEGFSGATVTVTATSSYNFTVECEFPADPLTTTLEQDTTQSAEVTATIKVTYSDGQISTAKTVFGVYLRRKSDTDTTDSRVYFDIGGGVPNRITRTTNQVGFDSIVIHSTATTFGHPTYIDCDIGEAYAIDNGVASSLNSYIALGSKLPKLSIGTSEITFDNTITSLIVIPRWWKI